MDDKQAFYESPEHIAAVEEKHLRASQENLMFAYEGVCAALVAERKRSADLADMLEVMHQYAPMGLHEVSILKMILKTVTDERDRLRSEFAKREVK